MQIRHLIFHVKKRFTFLVENVFNFVTRMVLRRVARLAIVLPRWKGRRAKKEEKTYNTGGSEREREPFVCRIVHIYRS